jgi:2-polyprenyl-3-methyl-5-hydroxy-6-metoxy-1,4-benzoquinol methylase
MKDAILGLIGKYSPTQKKKIMRFFSVCPNAEIELLDFLDMYKPYMISESITIEIMVDAYVELINQVMHSRLEFIRTGSYPAKSQNAALDEVYKNKVTMQQYMLGLALSYFLWGHHFRLLTFFKNIVRDVDPDDRILEVGCGHGLFLVELLKFIAVEANITVVDISQHSIDMTKALLHSVVPQLTGRMKFHHCDVLDFTTKEEAFDLIMVGEVLEHLDNPLDLLKHLATLLTVNGRIFVTTCANCPAIDHVYRFENVAAIKDIIHEAGLSIETELIAPSEDRDMKVLEKHQIDISFAAVLRKDASL